MTKVAPRTTQQAQTTGKVGIVGGFCTSTCDGRGVASSSVSSSAGTGSSSSAYLGSSDGGHSLLHSALTLLQLAMVFFVGTQLLGRSASGRKLLRLALGRSADGELPTARGGGRRAPPPPRGARQRGAVDPRLLGEL